MAEINFEDLGKTISNAAEAVGKKTEAFIAVQKLRGQIHSSERSIEKNYKDLGEIIFRRYAIGETVDEEVAIVCEEISQINANISEMKEELAKKRGCNVCPVCEAEVPREAMFCMKCGAQMPEEVAEPSESECEESATKEEEAKADNEDITVEEEVVVEDAVEEAEQEDEAMEENSAEDVEL